MTDQPVRYTFDRVVRMVLSAITLALLLLLLRYLSDVLIPFAIAVVLAYILNPLVSAFERKTHHRPLAVGITIFGVIVIGLALLVVMVPLIVGQIARFRDSLIRLHEDVAASIAPSTLDPPVPRTPPNAAGLLLDSPAESTPMGWSELRSAWQEYRENRDHKPRGQRLRELRAAVQGTYIGYVIDETIQYVRSDEFRGLLASTAKSVAAGGLTVISFLLNLILAVTGLIVVLIYLVFLLIDYPEYSRAWPGFLPPQYRGTIVDLVVQFDDALRRYLRGQSVVALITGTLECIGFTLIGLPMAIPFGIFIGLLTMVPYLPAVAIVPAALLAVLRAVEHGSSLVVSLLLTFAVMIVVQIAQDAFVVPKVMGKATGLKPVAILLGVFIWGKLLGFLGLVLAIPLTCLGIAYYRKYILQRTAAPAVETTSP